MDILAKNNKSFINFLYKNLTLIEEIDSKFQNIKICKSEKVGKCLFLDNIMQICEGDLDNYNIGLTKKMFSHLKENSDILIIGGGDGMLAEYINEKYIVNSITIIELDEMVPKLVNKHFRNGKMFCGDIYYENGIDFIKKCIENDKKFNGIIVDCTDFEEGSISSVLFNKDFYDNIKKILRSGGYLTQHYNTVDNLCKYQDGKFGVTYPIVPIENYHFELVNCFSYGCPIVILHYIKNSLN